MSFDGNWKITAETPIGPQETVLQFATEGATLTGTASGNGEIIEIYEGSVDGDSASWKIEVTRPMPLTVTFTAKLAGDEISGDAKAGPFPPSPFQGSRQP
jgi:hypothetical protein